MATSTKMKTFYPKTRAAWRAWLRAHHRTASEIWVVYPRKATGKPRISYNDAVEEALCFGWIDGKQRSIDDERFAQRFTPRRSGSSWSEMNKQRLAALIASNKMTKAGLAAAEGVKLGARLKVAPDIREALNEDDVTRRNFAKLPSSYKRVRIAYIESARSRPDEFGKRLRHFVKMTTQGKTFGYVKEFAPKR